MPKKDPEMPKKDQHNHSFKTLYCQLERQIYEYQKYQLCCIQINYTNRSDINTSTMHWKIGMLHNQHRKFQLRPVHLELAHNLLHYRTFKM